MALRSRNKVSANFNMSSMTDIVFLLLIFFMLTSTLVSPNALKLLLPNSKAKTLEKQTISVSITKDLQFYINENQVAENKIEKVLDTLIIDRKTDPNSMDTPRRLAKMYIKEIMSGRYDPMPNPNAFPNYVEGGYEGMLVVRSEIKSVCSHHHQPVSGVALSLIHI